MPWIERRSSGWLVRWLEHEHGRRTRSRSFRDEAEALAFKAEMEHEAHVAWMNDPSRPGYVDLFGLGPLDAADPTYALENFIREMVRAKRDLRSTTRALYLRNLRVHIEGTPLGRADVRSIIAQDLNTWWGSLDAGPGALRNAHQLVSMAFRRAVQTGLRDDNPLDRAPDVRKPSRRGRSVVPLTVEQIEALAEAATTARDRLEVLVMSYGGLRAGEVGGLRLEDVNWERSQLHLRQQVVRISGEGLEVTPLKTDAARRVVTLPRSVTDELHAFTLENPPAADGRIFHGLADGMRDHVRINTSVQHAAKRAEVRTHSHALRHTAVSLWIADGASPLDVQRMVGHSDVKETLGTYGHLFTYGGQALAESMERRREQHR